MRTDAFEETQMEDAEALMEFIRAKQAASLEKRATNFLRTKWRMWKKDADGCVNHRDELTKASTEHRKMTIKDVRAWRKILIEHSEETRNGNNEALNSDMNQEEIENLSTRADNEKSCLATADGAMHQDRGAIAWLLMEEETGKVVKRGNEKISA